MCTDTHANIQLLTLMTKTTVPVPQKGHVSMQHAVVPRLRSLQPAIWFQFRSIWNWLQHRHLKNTFWSGAHIRSHKQVFSVKWFLNVSKTKENEQSLGQWWWQTPHLELDDSKLLALINKRRRFFCLFVCFFLVGSWWLLSWSLTRLCSVRWSTEIQAERSF